MRLDKFLKLSRLIKRRTVAGQVAKAGRVLVNGKAAKPGLTLKVGDVVELSFADSPVRARVLSLEEPRGKDVAREMYEILPAGPA